MLKRIVFGMMLTLLMVSILTSALNIQPSKAEPEIIVVPDDYPTIQEAINHANDGDTIFVKSGVYNEHVIANKTISLVGEDRESTVIDAMGTGASLELTVNSVIVSNLTVRNGEIGINITNSHFHRIESNIIEDNTRGATGNYYTGALYYRNIIRRNQYGIDFGHLGGPSSINNTALCNELYDNFCGIYISAADGNNTVKDNIFYGNNIGLVLDNTRNNNIIGNLFRNNTRSGGFNDGIYIRNSAHNNVENNNFTLNNVGIFMDRSDNNFILRNIFSDNLYGLYLTFNESLIFIGWSFNNVIVKNSFEKNSYGFHSDIGAATFINSQFNTTFAENDMKNNSYGVHLSLADATISNNTFTNSDVGIHIELSGDSRVINNTIFNCNTGVNVKLSGGSIISDNVVWNSSSVGINVDLSGGSTISNNKVSNSNVGIRLSLSGNCLINGNAIVNNDHGIDISLSSDCMIYGNDFVNNIQQAAISLSSSNWNSTYPVGGNYWSDYKGVDQKSGPNQDQAGSDGIGDTPYVINEDNKDWYPLMNPLYEKLYKLTITSSIGGSTEPLPGTYSYINGSQVTVTAIPQAGYSFDHWLLDGEVRTENPITVIIDANHTLEAYFVDNILPTTTDNYDGLWHKSDFTIILTAVDYGSGVAETHYRINNGPVKGVSVDGQPLITTESANNSLEYWSVDNAGNEEEHKFLTGIKLDKTVPSIVEIRRQPEGDVEPNQAVKILVNATDSLSSVKDVILSYSIGDSPVWTDVPMALNATSGFYEGIIQGQQANAIVKYKITVYDNAGNCLIEDNDGQFFVYVVIPEFPSATILLMLILTSIVAFILTKNIRKKNK